MSARNAALALAVAALACAGCAQQDPAVRVTLSSSSFSIPANTDKLVLDVSDASSVVFFSRTYPLAAPMTFPLTVVLVESGADHSHIKVSARLLLRSSLVATGSGEVDFQGGKTVDLAISLAP